MEHIQTGTSNISQQAHTIIESHKQHDTTMDNKRPKNTNEQKQTVTSKV